MGIMNYELRITNYEFYARRVRNSLFAIRNSLFAICYLAAALPLLFAICCSLFAHPAQAQSEEVIAFWESDVPPETGWTVGDPISLRLRVIVPDSFTVSLPALPELWGDFEIRAQAAQASTTDSQGKVNHILDVTAVLWSPGEYETPPTTVTYQDAGGDTHEITPRPLTVSIASVLAEVTPDAEGQIEKQDLKPQAILPRPPVWPWILAGLATLPLLYLAGRWLWQRLPRRKRALHEPEAEPVDERFPEEIAYEKLDTIEALDLPARGEFKQHYILVTECVRAYVEGVYAIPALDSTTYELLGALRRKKLPGDTFAVARDLLNEADLVKFAKFAPSVEAARLSLIQARHFVDITKPDRSEALMNQESRIKSRQITFRDGSD